jgi:hypothetical protein
MKAGWPRKETLRSGMCNREAKYSAEDSGASMIKLRQLAYMRSVALPLIL